MFGLPCVWLLATIAWLLFIIGARLLTPWRADDVQERVSQSFQNSDLYAKLLDVRNAELSTLWFRFNLHFMINGGLLGLLLTADLKAGSLLDRVGVWPYFFGLALSLLWLNSELAGRYTLHQYDAKLRHFELAFWPKGKFYVFGDIPDMHPLTVFAHVFRWHMALSLVIVLVFICTWSTLIYLEMK